MQKDMYYVFNYYNRLPLAIVPDIGNFIDNLIPYLKDISQLERTRFTLLTALLEESKDNYWR